MSIEAPLFSARSKLAKTAWAQYLAVMKAPDEPMPSYFATGFHMGVIRGWKRDEEQAETIEEISRRVSSAWVPAIFDIANPGEWVVYEINTGLIYEVDTKTRQAAVEEARHSVYYQALPRPLAKEYANAFNHGASLYRKAPSH